MARRNPLVAAGLREIRPGGYMIHRGGREIGLAGFRPSQPGGDHNAWYSLGDAEPVAVTCVRLDDLRAVIRDKLRETD